MTPLPALADAGYTTAARDEDWDAETITERERGRPRRRERSQSRAETHSARQLRAQLKARLEEAQRAAAESDTQVNVERLMHLTTRFLALTNSMQEQQLQSHQHGGGGGGGSSLNLTAPLAGAVPAADLLRRNSHVSLNDRHGSNVALPIVAADAPVWTADQAHAKFMQAVEACVYHGKPGAGSLIPDSGSGRARRASVPAANAGKSAVVDETTISVMDSKGTIRTIARYAATAAQIRASIALQQRTSGVVPDAEPRGRGGGKSPTRRQRHRTHSPRRRGGSASESEDEDGSDDDSDAGYDANGLPRRRAHRWRAGTVLANVSKYIEEVKAQDIEITKRILHQFRSTGGAPSNTAAAAAVAAVVGATGGGGAVSFATTATEPASTTLPKIAGADGATTANGRATVVPPAPAAVQQQQPARRNSVVIGPAVVAPAASPAKPAAAPTTTPTKPVDGPRASLTLPSPALSRRASMVRRGTLSGTSTGPSSATASNPTGPGGASGTKPLQSALSKKISISGADRLAAEDAYDAAAAALWGATIARPAMQVLQKHPIERTPEDIEVLCEAVRNMAGFAPFAQHDPRNNVNGGLGIGPGTPTASNSRVSTGRNRYERQQQQQQQVAGRRSSGVQLHAPGADGAAADTGGGGTAQGRTPRPSIASAGSLAAAAGASRRRRTGPGIDTIRQLCKVATVAYFRPGQEVFRQGESGTRWYVVIRGRVDINVAPIGVPTARIKVATLSFGQGFGELALVNNNPRSATVTCCVLPEGALVPSDDADTAARQPAPDDLIFLTVEKSDYIRIARAIHHRELQAKIALLTRVPALAGLTIAPPTTPNFAATMNTLAVPSSSSSGKPGGGSNHSVHGAGGAAPPPAAAATATTSGSSSTLSAIASVLRWRTCLPSEVLLRQGQPVGEFFFIRRGFVDIYRDVVMEVGPDGEYRAPATEPRDPAAPPPRLKTVRVRVARKGPGEYFGEEWVVRWGVSDYLSKWAHVKNEDARGARQRFEAIMMGGSSSSSSSAPAPAPAAAQPSSTSTGGGAKRDLPQFPSSITARVVGGRRTPRAINALLAAAANTPGGTRLGARGSRTYSFSSSAANSTSTLDLVGFPDDDDEDEDDDDDTLYDDDDDEYPSATGPSGAAAAAAAAARAMRVRRRTRVAPWADEKDAVALYGTTSPADAGQQEDDLVELACMTIFDGQTRIKNALPLSGYLSWDDDKLRVRFLEARDRAKWRHTRRQVLRDLHIRVRRPGGFMYLGEGKGGGAGAVAAEQQQAGEGRARGTSRRRVGSGRDGRVVAKY
ncbi:hypothetical protein H9P43_000788 [Blastocladiella emersonii ATCC 22665]|nr:hypothetical protein H9P43_000788 [Blastocladiella emersonii ATCC 22665]